MKTLFALALALTIGAAALAAPAYADDHGFAQQVRSWNDRGRGHDDWRDGRGNHRGGWNDRDDRWDRRGDHRWGWGGRPVFAPPRAYIWVPGFWDWSGYGWVWVPGYYR